MSPNCVGRSKASRRRNADTGAVGWARALLRRAHDLFPIGRGRGHASAFALRATADKSLCPPTRLRPPLIIDPQPHAAMDGVADRLRAQRAVGEQIDDPALLHAEA